MSEAFWTRRSDELEARYRAGDYTALIEAVLQFSDQKPDLARPLPAWAWPAVVEHLQARFAANASGRKGAPGPQEKTGEFDKRNARYKTVAACLSMERLGGLDLAWVNRTRVRRGLKALRPGDMPNDPSTFDFAHAVLRGSPAAAAAKTIANDYYRVQKERGLSRR